MSALRRPSEKVPARIEPLARLPVFLALDGKRAVVAGGTSAAAWKAELLSAAGANVDVYSRDPSDEMIALASRSLCSCLTIHRRNWAADDLNGAAVAIGACADDHEAQMFVDAARIAGVPVNVIDKSRFCDFSFGSIVNRSPLVIGISTDGAAPILAQAIRARLEAFLPRGLARWATAAARWRPTLMRSGLSFAARRKFWQHFAVRAVSHPDCDPFDNELERFLAEVRALGAAVETGFVTLVGAGPGDPDLLTLRAVRALQSADIVLFDDLVSDAILDYARREARRMLVGKTGHGASCSQDDINTLMVKLAKAGKHVVRLKGGDPMIFGRAGEEIAACRTAGITVEVVPGITAAQGAAAQLALPLTHRGEARRVQYITGHGIDGVLPADIDWRSLADPATTTAVYMPTRTLAAIVESALGHGLDPYTPAVAVAGATRPEQMVIAERIADLPRRLAEEAPPGPILVMIGRLMAAQMGHNGINRRTSARAH